MEERDPLTHEVIGAAIEVHREMGPGLLEAVYQKCMECELRLRGLKCQHQFRIPLAYKGENLDSDLIMDHYFPGQLVVELTESRIENATAWRAGSRKRPEGSTRGAYASPLARDICYAGLSKAVDKLIPVHDAQLLTYLRLSKTHVGLLINFDVPILKNGVKRLVH